MKRYSIQLIEVCTYFRDLEVPANSYDEADAIVRKLGLEGEKGLKRDKWSYTKLLSVPKEIPAKPLEDGQKLLDNKYKEQIKPSTNVNDD